MYLLLPSSGPNLRINEHVRVKVSPVQKRHEEERKGLRQRGRRKQDGGDGGQSVVQEQQLLLDIVSQQGNAQGMDESRGGSSGEGMLLPAEIAIFVLQLSLLFLFFGFWCCSCYSCTIRCSFPSLIFRHLLIWLPRNQKAYVSYREKEGQCCLFIIIKLPLKLYVCITSLCARDS